MNYLYKFSEIYKKNDFALNPLNSIPEYAS